MIRNPGVRTAKWAAALAISLPLASGAAKGAAEVAIAGQLILPIDAASTKTLTIKRAGVHFRPRPKEFVYLNDEICARPSGPAARLAFRGTDEQDVPYRDNAGQVHTCFVVKEKDAIHWVLEKVNRVMDAMAAAPLAPQASTVPVITAPEPLRGPPLEFDQAIFGQAQTLRASEFGVLIPVRWRGKPSLARLLDSDSSVVAEAEPNMPGFARLYAPALPAGAYKLVIGLEPHMKTVSITVVAQPAPRLPEADATMAAAETFQAHPNARLQALIDLCALARSDAVASAALRSALGTEAGEYMVGAAP